MRIKTHSGDENPPRIDPKAVEKFFSIRAEKSRVVGPLRAVIYQDKNPNLAERRDAAEKTLLVPKLQLSKDSRVLDIGCGTGRWTSVLAAQVNLYHGTDFAPGLVDIATCQYGNLPNVSFSTLSSTQIDLDSLGQSIGFDKILILGLLIYLNDDDLFETLNCAISVSAPNCRLLIREPIATAERLTIKEHYSEDMDQEYNAIYRTEDELLGMTSDTLGRAGFKLIENGFVYSDDSMNNRSDTIQKWYLLDKQASL